MPVGGGPPARSPHASFARSARSRGPPWPCRHPPAPQPPPPPAGLAPPSRRAARTTWPCHRPPAPQPHPPLTSHRPPVGRSPPPAPLYARTTGSKRDKILPARHKTLILVCFTRAGRVLSRHPGHAWATPRIHDDQLGASHRNESHDGLTRIGYLDPDRLISYPDALNHCCQESNSTHARPATTNRRASRAASLLRCRHRPSYPFNKQVYPVGRPPHRTHGRELFVLRSSPSGTSVPVPPASGTSSRGRPSSRRGRRGS